MDRLHLKAKRVYSDFDFHQMFFYAIKDSWIKLVAWDILTDLKEITKVGSYE